MRVTYEAPIQFVSQDQYYADRGRRYQLEELEIGADHNLRLVTNLDVEYDYAADYSIVIDDIIVPKKRRLSKILPQLVQVSLLPIDPFGAVMDQKPDVIAIQEDGVLQNTSKKIWLLPQRKEIGYFAPGDNDENQDARYRSRLLSMPR